MKDFYVYLLRCGDGSFCAGHTDDLEKRLAEHCDGIGSLYTARKRPVTLVFSCVFSAREEAFIVERKIKAWTRKKKEALTENNWKLLSELSKKRFVYRSNGSIHFD